MSTKSINANQTIKITVKNWEKYQGNIRKKSGVTKFTWWARSNHFSQDDKMRSLGAIGRDVFCTILDMCSERNENCITVVLRSLHGRITVGLGSFQPLRMVVLRSCLGHMQALDLVEFDFTHNITKQNNNRTIYHPTDDSETDHIAKANDRILPHEKLIDKPVKKTKPKTAKPKELAPTSLIWDAYRLAYLERYRTEPIRGSKQNGVISHILRQVSQAEAIELAKFYVLQNDSWYVQKTHALEFMLSDLQKLTVQMRTGHRVTRKQAETVERSSTNQSEFQKALKALEEQKDDVF